MLFALIDSIKSILEWVEQYGADTVFMVFFFIMFVRGQRRISIIQDARLEDNKKAVEALIEAKHAIDEAHDVGEEISEEVRQNRRENQEQFGKLRGKLNILIQKVE